MKPFLIIHLLFILHVNLWAQSVIGSSMNLTRNYSFENYSSCPISDGLLFLATPWISPTSATPDYFNECSSNAQSSVPTSTFGHRWPRTGKGYAGFITYVNGMPETREFIQVELSDSLIQGKLYCVGFYVSLGETFDYSSNGLSAYFSTTPISCSTCSLPYTPQINYLGTPIADTLNWTLISGTFIATGGEKYATIGNFNSDANTSVSLVNSSGSGGVAAYYYIDDVYVGTCDTIKPPVIVSSLSVPNIFTPNSDGVNDVFKVQGSNIQTLTCSIYDRWGGKVWELKNPLENWDGRNPTGMPCNEGVYYYVLDAKGEDGKAYHKTGFVQLMR
jgi:gliding motility-associated-like protein